MANLIPPDETERLNALRAYDILDTFPEEDLDAITRLASEICHTPIALISLIDQDRQWFKANVGLDAKETPRDISFCQHTILGDTVFEVPNAIEDKAFSNNTFVTGNPKIRFYAGAPLINPEGYKLGSLCVIDTVPKLLDENQKRALTTLSSLIINQFELRRKKKEIEEARNQYHKMIEDAGDIIYTTNAIGSFQYVSNAVTKIAGFSPEELKGKHFSMLVDNEWQGRVNAFYRKQVRDRIKETNFEFLIITRDGEKKWVEQNVVVLHEAGKIKGFQGIVRDINTRKEIETRLATANKVIEETKNTLQSILDNTSSVIFIKDLEYRYTMVNKQFEKVFNVVFDDISFQNDYDFRNENNAIILQQNDWEVFNKKMALDFEYTFMINGDNRTFLITKFPLYDDAGLMYGLCGVYTEITAQKKVEQLLRERDERFTKIFHSSPAALVLATLNPNRLQEVNQSFTQLTGYTQAEIIGKNTSEIGMIHDEDRAPMLKIFEDKGVLRNYEIMFFDKHGNKKYALLSTEIVEIDGLQYGLSLYYDITQRKQYEKELADARALLVEAMEIGRMGRFENNIAEQKITWSKEVYDIMEMEYNSRPFNYEEYLSTIHPADIDLVLEKIQEAYKNKQSDVTVNRFITKNGKIKWIETRVVPNLDRDGEIAVFRGTMQDITELKETELELRFAKELAEQSVIAKEQFLANMSHEIRTPMNGVLGFTDLLSKTSLDKDQRGFVRAIETSGKNLMALINDILDYSKIEAGMMSIDETPLSIPGIFSSLSVLFNERAKQKKLKLIFRCDKKIPNEVIGDPVRLTQIITNLVGNSIKFTEKGTVSLTAKLLEKTPDVVKILLRVKDTGVGISHEILPFIFDRFNQGSNDTTRKYGGTGLGLSIVKKLTELQGGSIDVESSRNKGSVFSVIIPYKIAPEEKDETPEELDSSMHDHMPDHLSILLVEDNILNQKLAERVLNGFGFTVEIAGNGKIAVNKIRKKHYDLILMDMQMPEMNGYEATEVIRSKLRNSIPIIAMTAHAMGSEKEKCLALGMNDYISKPFRADELYNKISSIYTHHKPVVGKKSPIKNERTKMRKKSVINFTYLIKITGGNKEFIHEMLQMFVSEVPPDLEAIRNAIHEKNYATIKNIAHKLKSSVPVVGLDTTLLLPLAEMEKLAEGTTNLPLIKKLFLTVDKRCGEAIKEIQSGKFPDNFELTI